MEEKSEEVSQPEATKISRRELLRKGITLGTSLTVYWVHLFHERSKIFPFRKERHLAKTPEGYKVGMISGVHGELDSPLSEITPIKEKDLFSPMGALFLDECVDYLNPKIQAILPAAFENVTHPFLKEPIKHALESKLPIILGDITLKEASVDDFLKAGKRSLFLNLISSALASAGVVWETVFREEISRRKFFRLLGLGGALGAIHFSTEATVKIGRKLGIRPDSEIGRDFQAILTDVSHPEDFFIVMRNIVWALKCRDLYERNEVSKDKVTNVIGGAWHQFFDFFVRHPEIARRYWHLFGYKKAAAEFSGGDTGWVYQSYVYDPATKKGRIITHENLKELVA